MTGVSGPPLRFDASVASHRVTVKGNPGLELTWATTSPPYRGTTAESGTHETPLGSWEITGIPRNGPIDIFRRPVASPTERYEILRRHTVVHRKAKVDPMGDAEFWSLIDILGGRAASRPMAKLREALRERGADATSRFAVALHLRLFDLDHPANAVLTRGRGLEYLSDDASQDRRAAIIALGRAEFDRAIAEPGSVAGERGGAEPLIYIANRVLSNDAEHILLHTGVPLTTGSNAQHWPAAVPPPSRPPMTKEERTREWQRQILSTARVVGEHPTPEDPWYDVARQCNWYAVLWLAGTPMGLRESLSVFAIPSLDLVRSAEQEAVDAQRVRDVVAQRALEAGEGLIGSIDVEVCGRPLRLREIATLVVTE